MKKITISILFLGAFGFPSCKKSSQTSGPVITMVEPKSGDTVMLHHHSIHMMSGAKDEHGLHEIKAEIKDFQGKILFTEIKHIDEKEYVYHQHTSPTGMSGLTKVTYTFTATNHDERVSTQSVDFYLMP